jgi:FAR1 DNA-binding domain
LFRKFDKVLLLQDDKLNPEMVPTLEKQFKDEKEAWDFYRTYAEHAGFGIKKNRKRKRGQEYSCTFEGKHKEKTKEVREREKTSMRMGCKAMVQVHMSKDGEYTFFKRIVLEHNHPLIAGNKGTRHMRSHKDNDPSLWEYVDELHAAKVRPNATMTLLKDAVGGTDNLKITEQDLHNRYWY